MKFQQVVVLSSLLFLSTTAAPCQSPSVKKSVPVKSPIAQNDYINLSSKQFTVWTRDKKKQFEKELAQGSSNDTTLKSTLNLLGKALFARLKANKEVNDDSVGLVVYCWYSYEARPLQNVKSVPQYTNTKRVINSLLPYFYDRPLLSAGLRQRLAQLSSESNNAAQATSEYEKAYATLNNLHIQIDEQRVSVAISIAGIAFSSGDKIKAEKFYIEALRYDWTKIREPEAFQRLRNLYIQAGRGLIQVRRGDLGALKNTSFYTSAMRELGPELKQAIREADEKRLSQ